MASCHSGGSSRSFAADDFGVVRKKRGSKGPSKGCGDQVVKTSKAKSTKSAPTTPKWDPLPAEPPPVIQVEVNGGAEPDGLRPAGQPPSRPTSSPPLAPSPSPKLQPWQRKLQLLAEDVPPAPAPPPWELDPSPSPHQSPSLGPSRLTPSSRRNHPTRHRPSPPLTPATASAGAPALPHPLDLTRAHGSPPEPRPAPSEEGTTQDKVTAVNAGNATARNTLEQQQHLWKTAEDLLRALSSRSPDNRAAAPEVDAFARMCQDAKGCGVLFWLLKTVSAPDAVVLLSFTLQRWGDVVTCLTTADEPALDVSAFTEGLKRCIQLLPLREVLAVMGALNRRFSLRQLLTLLEDPRGMEVVTVLLEQGAEAKGDAKLAAVWADAATRFFDNAVDHLIFLCSDYAASGPCIAMQFLQVLHRGLPAYPRSVLEAELRHCCLAVGPVRPPVELPLIPAALHS